MDCNENSLNPKMYAQTSEEEVNIKQSLSKLNFKKMVMQLTYKTNIFPKISKGVGK